MKLLFKNKRYILSASLTILMVFCTLMSGYANITPVADRTPQIRDAIVAAVPGVITANDVTAAHLAAITTLNGSNTSISALKAGDFDGLTALTTLDLSRNTISDISTIASLTTLTALEMSQNSITDISVLEKLTKLKWLYLHHNSISDISKLEKLTSLKILWLNGNSISDISVIEKLTKLKKLSLGGNSISDISALEDLTQLNLLWLAGNTISDVSPLEKLTRLTSLTLSGNPISDLEPLSKLKAANPRMSIDITIDNDDDDDNSDNDNNDNDNNDDANNAPVFAGSSTTRSIAENTNSGVNIGNPVSATDADSGDTLTYTLGGTDASSFSIVSTSGQLRTNTALDYETKSSYSVSVSVSDGNDGTDNIAVTINVTNVNEAPSFATNTATRSIAENSAVNVNIGGPIAATDVDANTTLSYTLGGTDAAAFSIVSTTGQIQTSAALDYETKNSYSVTVTAADGTGDGSLSASINVTINVTDANDAPVFTAGDSTTRSIAENSVANTIIGAVVSATDQDKKPDPENPAQLIAKDTITYSIPTTGDAATFSIDSTTGQLKTKNALNYETKNSYTVVVTASDGTLTDTITVTISITDVNEAPTFASGATISNVSATKGTAITSVTLPAATDPDANNTITYSVTPALPAGLTFKASTRVLSGTPTTVSASTTYTYTASDSNLSSTLTFSIQVSAPPNNAPTFTEGTSTTRSVDENTASGQNIGAPVGATDADNDTLTYTLGGTDASSFNIVSDSGQLQTSAALDRETKSSYSVTITADDGNSTNNTDTIDVTISVTDVNEAPSFASSTATRSIAENTATNQNIGAAFTATDQDKKPDPENPAQLIAKDTITYSIPTTEDAAAFSIDSNTGQLKTKNALNYESKNSYSVVVTASDGSLTDTITVTISITNVNEAPTFASGTTISNISATKGTAITSVTLPAATDPDANNTITYTVTPALPAGLTFTASTRVLSGTPTAVTSSTTYTYTASDSNLSATLTFTIQVSAPANNPPTFTEGTSTTRSVAENTASDTNIGTAVGATDSDNHTITYTLGGTDAASFSIVGTSGQIQTSADLDYETDNAYSVTVTANDGNGGTDSIDVTISVTDANDAPVFTAGDSTTRSIAENSVANTSIGAVVSATDEDKKPDPENPAQLIAKDTITYSIPTSGDAAAFSIDSTTGQLKTKNALNYESKNSYSVVVTASDGNLTDTITVTISITDVNEAPAFASGASISSISATKGTAITSVTLPAATDPDANATITYTVIPALPAGLTFTASSRVLAGTPTAVSDSTTYTYTASDSNLSDTLTFTIQVSAPPNNAPTFTEGTSTTRSVAENTASGEDIGTAVGATDSDNDTLTYTLGGTDASSFSIVSSTGQLETSAALDRETKSSYSVTITADDGNTTNNTDTIDVTITVTNVNEAPSFSSTGRVTISVAENTAANTNIGDAFQATDPDSGDTVTYSLQRADKTSFRLDANTGQLKTHTALDYETKTSYTNLAVRATDSGGLNRSVLVTVNVTNVNDNSPEFTEGTSTTRSVEENSPIGTNVGTPVTATDADNDTLGYTLGGADAASFYITELTGQIHTYAAMDYETKSSYSVTVSVNDAVTGGNRDSITVTISVTNVVVENPPVFTDGTSTTRSVAENTALDTKVGSPVTATDADTTDTLTYTLGGTDAASFRIDSETAQLKTNAAIDYEVKSSYTVSVSVSDGNGGSDNITVTINVTDETETPISPPLSQRTAKVRTAIVAAAPGVSTVADVTVAHLAAITSLDLSNKRITALQAGDFNGLTGMGTLSLGFNSISDISALSGLTQLTHLDLSSNSITDISALSGLTSMKYLHLSRNSLTDISSLSGMTSLTNLNLDYNSIIDISSLSGMPRMSNLNLRNNNVGDISALSGMTLMETLNLWGNNITDVSAVSGMSLLFHLSLSWNPISDYTPVRTLKAAKPSLIIDINLNNNPPAFTEGTTTTRSIPERTASGTNIGNPVAATDADNHTLNYSLSGTDANSFVIVPETGQLQTFAALDYETKTSYAVTITVYDGNHGGDKITVTINVTDVGESAPVFTDGTSTTRSVAENTALGTNVGTPVAATDADNDPLTYTLSGTDEASFIVDDETGQILTNAAMDYEVKSSYTVTLSVSDTTNISDRITVTINVTDVSVEPTISPVLNFRTPVVRQAIVEEAPGVSTVADVTVAHLAAITKLNLNKKSLTFVQSTDFNGLTGLTSIDLGSNSLTSVSPLSGLTQLTSLNLSSNSLTELSALSGLTNLTELNLGSNSITNISALSGMTNLTYLNLSSNSITDISALSGMTSMDTIDLRNTSITNVSAMSGMTSLSYVYIADTSISDYAPLRTLQAANPNLVIDVNINNNPPTFDDGTSTTRSIAENTKGGKNIGSAVAATDDDNDTLTYTLGGTDVAAFVLHSTTGQLQTKAALDYETKSSYVVTITVDDGNNGSDSIDVTINVTDVNEPPAFTDGTSTTRYVAADAASGVNIGSPVAATDPDTGDTLAYTLSGTDAASFSIVGTSGQLQTSAALDEDTETYSVTVSVSDGNGGSDSITVTISTGSPITPVKDRTTQVRDAIVAAVTGVTNADDVTETHLAAITEIDLQSKSITALKAGDFSGLTGLETLYLNHASLHANEKNSISDISMLEGLTTLTRLNLSDNQITDISVLSGMTSMGSLYLDNNSISDISALSGMTEMNTLEMTNNNVVDISHLSGMTSLSILSVAGNPISDYATIRTLQSHSLFGLDISLNNNPPTFTDGATTTRTVFENTPAGQNIGTAVAATDADNHTLSYSLGGTDADSFSIVSTSGQIQTKAALDFATKNSYTVTVTAYDGNNGGDRITVTIRVRAALGSAPSIEESSVIPENTALLSNYPNPFNPETWIPYQLATPAEVTLTIYDVRGRVVRTLILGNQPAGVYQSRSKAAHWDGRNLFGEKVATGVYFYTLKAGNYMATRKLMIRK